MDLVSDEVNQASLNSLKLKLILDDVGVSLENFKFVVNAEDYGFDPTETPRTDKIVRCFLDLREMTVFVILVGSYDCELETLEA